MSFFKGLGKVINDVKGFVEEAEQNNIDRKKKELAKLKEANKKKSEKDGLNKALAAERAKLRGDKNNNDESWF